MSTLESLPGRAVAATTAVIGAEEEEEEYVSAALNARELEWACNSDALIQEHKDRNQGVIRTRFPPEPNGYLHIGHAKSMNMNFRLAFEKLKVPMHLRRTIFRYDDTNPDAEETEYIDSLRRDCEWLGWKPERTTYASDNFQILYDFAVQLIRKGLAYVCDMTKAEMEAQRELAMKRANAVARGQDPDVVAPIPSPDILPGRNREAHSIERNLEMFEKMKLGLFEEGAYTLRLKMDFESPNPNLYDLVAYRIKYTPHPHAGPGWCIYPAYDYTHGICDSLEDIDYSICTLEFEARREPYYWILWALDLYRPKVYEMSRLNLEYTVLSKRRLIKLVDAKHVRGWDDPRMPTISGLRRRGYTADVLNAFCNDVGATRSANVVEMHKLHSIARVHLAPVSPRVMTALQPIKVVITNHPGKHMEYTVANSPTDETMGEHTIQLTPIIYIDRTDFRFEDSKEYYGLAPQKAVGLKYYGGNLICDQVIKKSSSSADDYDQIVELQCRVDDSPDRSKPKTFLSWVPDTGLRAEVRVYDHLFLVPEPTELWEDELNPGSEVVYENAIIDPSVKLFVDGKQVDKWKSGVSLQFERLGYFVVDYETTFDPDTGSGKLVFNRTVSLKEDPVKKKLSDDEMAALEAKKAAARNAVAEKEQRMQIDPLRFFQLAPEYQGKFSTFDPATGFPTHDAEGNELTKSALKKLAKDKEKHVKQLAKWQQSQEKAKK
jgi:glutaminyl-tRNA synthetase